MRLRSGTDPAYIEAAGAFGAIMARNGIGLVYGGGTVGMMGEVANAVANNGGEVTGIIPNFLMTRERPTQGLNNLIVTADMHERKRKMFEMADAFVALPGGIGTLEEIVEQMTWAQSVATEADPAGQYQVFGTPSRCSIT